MATSTPANAVARALEFERLLKAVRDSPSLSEQSNAVVISGKLWRRIADSIDEAPRQEAAEAQLQIARKALERLEAKTRIEGKPTNAIEAMLADYNNIASEAIAAINGADK